MREQKDRHWQNWAPTDDDRMVLRYDTHEPSDDSGETLYEPDADLEDIANTAGEEHLKKRCEKIIRESKLDTLTIKAGDRVLRQTDFDFDEDINYNVNSGDYYTNCSMEIRLRDYSPDEAETLWFEEIRDTLVKELNQQNEINGNCETFICMAESLYDVAHSVDERDPATFIALENSGFIYGEDCCLIRIENASDEDVAHHRSFTMTEDEKKMYEFVKEKKAVNNLIDN